MLLAIVPWFTRLILDPCQGFESLQSSWFYDEQKKLIGKDQIEQVNPGRATATGGMRCMGASLFQPPLMIFEVLELSLEWIKSINKENKKSSD